MGLPSTSNFDGFRPRIGSSVTQEWFGLWPQRNMVASGSKIAYIFKKMFTKNILVNRLCVALCLWYQRIWYWYNLQAHKGLKKEPRECFYYFSWTLTGCPLPLKFLKIPLKLKVSLKSLNHPYFWLILKKILTNGLILNIWTQWAS